VNLHIKKLVKIGWELKELNKNKQTNKQTNKQKQLIMKTIETINKNFLKDCDTLQKNLTIKLIEKFEIGKEITVRLSKNGVEVALLNKDKKVTTRNTVFGSEINLYVRECWRTNTKTVEMNFGSTGSFSPTKQGNEGAVWRTLSAASFINNWEELESVVKAFCLQFERLCDTAHFERGLVK